MADRPIIFSAPMVRALIEGRKTQTRRVLKPQPCVLGPLMLNPIGHSALYLVSYQDNRWKWLPHAPGDRLWVRETWAHERLSPDPDNPDNPDPAEPMLLYRASHSERPGVFWRSPIHMPRWASRLTLTVTGVRVQRVQEISEADAEAEGVDQRVNATCRDDFRDLWTAIHGLAAWDANPWVAAITFTARKGNIDAGGADGPV